MLTARLLVPLLLLVCWGAAPSEAASPTLGINLAGPADWNTELPFVDVFRMSRPWISQREGAGWGKGPQLQLDQWGWVTQLQPGCFAETPLCTIEGGHYPSGVYTVFYEGEGELTFNNAEVVERSPGNLRIRPNVERGGFFLQLRSTNPENYVRNIRVIMPGFEDRYRQHPFHPDFLKRWNTMVCFRFMDWMHTNNSEQEQWSDRPTPRHATFSRRGVALEWMIELCNRTGADPWFCLPHRANDDYLRRFAKLVKERLDPELTVYVEYSNEVWNGQFAQHRFAGEQGQRLRLAEKPWEAAWAYTALRSTQIFKIFEQEFGGRQRLVRVLPTQAANPYVSKQILGFRDAAKHCDALAIAPYMSYTIHDAQQVDAMSRWSVDRLLDDFEAKALPKAVGWMKAQKETADQYGVKLIAYEAGQHMVAAGGDADAIDRLSDRMHAANRHPRMGKMYAEYYDAWEHAGGELMTAFSSVGRYSKWGAWGLAEHYQDRPEDYPKLKATLATAEEWNR